ncbi:MAG: FkbM family methyltransferase [Actinomycetota bacterium]|nr:FkbM family methyltransferase [Actinomycetota bacterium]
MSLIAGWLHARAAARHSRDTSRDFEELLGGTRLRLVDVGAAGELEPRWRRVSGAVDYVGFEPDERSRARLLANDQGCASYRILDTALSDQAGDLDLHLCRKPMASSSFEPDADFLGRFPDVGRFDVVGTVVLPARRLDDLDLAGCDFIKVDVQGAELAVLRGASGMLDACLGVEAEVEFLPMYRGQPLFGEVSGYLSTVGLEFVDFVSLNRWRRDRFDGHGQLVSADALFLRAPEQEWWGSADAATVTRYAGICALYHRYDLVRRLVDMHPSITLGPGQQDALNRMERRFDRSRRPVSTAQSWLQVAGSGEAVVHLTY